MKPGNQSARGASRSSWGSLSGFALYFFPRDGDEADDAVASTSLASWRKRRGGDGRRCDPTAVLEGGRWRNPFLPLTFPASVSRHCARAVGSTHTTVGQGHPRKPRLEHATRAPRPSRIVAEHWRWGARRARGTP
ncbi:hypothetical protein LSM04_001252 [Trypanosoma melophagium]|uniref:uncharacterized protein n=1 Tax=Trypanosoma melophagium TaxID=715481 RepID=UPI00351A7DE3|nr:hypothetical protein LSM04_001252 [Trypanosoma melophagium]